MIEAFDDESKYLQMTLDKYHDKDTQIKALRVLRAWLKKHPSTTLQELQKKFESLGFTEAAKR